MNKKEKIFKFFGQNTQLERQAAINRAIKEFTVTETTAATYYQAWRKEYIKPDPEPLTSTNNSIKVDVVNAVKKAGISTTIPVKKEEKVPSSELKEEIATKEPEEIKSLPIKQETIMKLIPIMFKGPVFTFAIDEAGIKIIDGKSDMVTEDIIQEQQAALEIFKDLYCEKVPGGGSL